MVLVVASSSVERGQRRITRAVREARGRAARVRRRSPPIFHWREHRRSSIPLLIFASSIRRLPDMFADHHESLDARGLRDAVAGCGMPLYNLLFMSLIIFFAYFYTSIIFNPNDVAENMRKYGRLHSGHPARQTTAEHLDTILTPDHPGGRNLPGAHRDLADFMITGFQVQRPSVDRRLARCSLPPQLHHQGLGPDFLFRRYLAADRGRCGDGHDSADRSAADHAPLRWLHEDTKIRGAGRSVAGPSRRNPGSPRRPGKGTQAVRLAQSRGIPKISTGISCARRRRVGAELGLRAKALIVASYLAKMMGREGTAGGAEGCDERLHPRRLPTDAASGRSCTTSRSSTSRCPTGSC